MAEQIASMLPSALAAGAWPPSARFFGVCCGGLGGTDARGFTVVGLGFNMFLVRLDDARCLALRTLAVVLVLGKGSSCTCVFSPWP